MRLREIKSMLNEYGNNIKVKSETIANSSDKMVLGLQKSINNIEGLSVLGFLDPDIKRLKTLGEQIYYMRSTDDKIRVDSKVYNKIKQHVQIINEKITGFQQLIDHAIPENRENVINIKLPDYQEIDKLGAFYKDLDLALRTGLTIKELEGTYKLQNFDSGSLWTEIVLNNVGSILFFGKLLKLTIEINKQSTENKIAKKKLDELIADSDVANQPLSESLKQQLDSEIDKKIDEKISSLQLENQELSPESKTSIRKSIKTLSDLLDEGTKFYPSSEEVDDVKQAFPELPKQLTEPQKLLKEHSPEDDD